MKKYWMGILAMVAVLACLLAVNLAFAEDEDDDVTSASIGISNESSLEWPFMAEVSLADAVRIAEEQVDGRTWFAALENENGFLVYDIEVVTTDGDIVDFLIDAGNGAVLEMEVDNEDDEGSEDDDD